MSSVTTSGTSASTSRPTFYRNLYVSGLPPPVGDNELFTLFAQYGNILSAKVMLDVNTGVSRGFGFVLFEREEEGCRAFAAANNSAASLNGTSFTLHVGPSQHDGRQAVVESSAIYVRNIPAAVADDEVSNYFSQFGAITGFSSRADTSTTATSPGGKVEAMKLASVEFKTVAQARDAIAHTHGKKVFPSCAKAVLAKFADSSEAKEAKRQKKIQQWQQKNLPPPMYSPSSAVSAAGPSTVNVLPGQVPIPLPPRGEIQQIYYKGVLGLTPDGRLYPINPEQVYYLNEAKIAQTAGLPIVNQSLATTAMVAQQMLAQSAPVVSPFGGMHTVFVPMQHQLQAPQRPQQQPIGSSPSQRMPAIGSSQGVTITPPLSASNPTIDIPLAVVGMLDAVET